MKQNTKWVRRLACTLFVILPVVFCTALLVCATPAGPAATGPVLCLRAFVRQGAAQDGQPELEYTIELSNEGDAPWLEGEITHWGWDGRQAGEIEINDKGLCEGYSTSGQGLVVAGVHLRPGDVLRVRYGVHGPAPGTGQRVTAKGSLPGGGASELAIDVQAME